mgnify:CR=1 FL=1|tara:strand:+ start:600 stop:2324 length:1725 start_codon:yes stop_codon:yes gene_type:complete
MKTSLLHTTYKSSAISIGGVEMGGKNPIRIQSMTSTDTMDTIASLEQSERIINAGADYVRLTTQGLREVENLKNIQDILRKKGIETPLIADIHFNPKAAEEASKFVAKVRINPGNYVDKNDPEKSKYLQTSYSTDLEKIASNIYPLLSVCRENETVIRIGTNHGSLSQRIMARYGNTPLGMVESAMEFVKICNDFGFKNIVLSMKSSNIKVMVHAYRMLVERLLKEDLNFPIHLGVTEAGNGDEGRIKSAIGIGTLLKEGIGDTIRVSLTEDPEHEIPVAKKIVEYANPESLFFESIDPFEYNKRKTKQFFNIGRDNSPVVISENSNENSDLYFDRSNQTLVSKNYQIKIGGLKDDFDGVLVSACTFMNDVEEIKDLANDRLIVLEAGLNDDLRTIKECFSECIKQEILCPIILKLNYKDLNADDLLFKASIDLGSLLVDGLVDGVWIQSEDDHNSSELAFKILQASGSRITETEFIACPSCGRTLYNIQDAFAKVKEATAHLKGLKIAVMGCVVNGPGEMADADYGYVGAGKCKVNLYKNRDLVRKGVHEDEAIQALIDLIKENGDWQDLPTN